MMREMCFGSMAVLCALQGGCAASAEEPSSSSGPAQEDVGEASVAKTDEALTNRCTIGCPSGYHAAGYFCSATCRGDCFAAYDSTECDPDTGSSFTKCEAFSSCPTGYHVVGSTCSQSCFGSPGHFCSSGTKNATICARDPSCSLSETPYYVGVGGYYTYTLSSNVVGTAFWYGTKNGSADAFGVYEPNLSNTYSGQATFYNPGGLSGTYGRYLVLKDGGGNTLCTTNSVYNQLD